MKKFGVFVILLALCIYYQNDSSSYPKKPLMKPQIDRAVAHDISLSAGNTHYRLYGKNSATTKGLIVCIHGFSMHSGLWHNLAKEMAEDRGYQVLTYDLYGRGGSDAPNIPHTPELFSSQLAELLLKLRTTNAISSNRIYLIGLSMGGAIATKFAQVFPELVEHLILMAPAGIQVPVPFVAKILNFPILGEFLADLGPYIMQNHIHKAFPPLEQFINPVERQKMVNLIEEARKELLFQFENHPGFARSLLSTLRHFPLADMEQIYQSLKDFKRISVFWGDLDVTTPFASANRLKQILPSSDLYVIHGAAHGFVQSHHSAFSRLLFACLEDHQITVDNQ